VGSGAEQERPIHQGIAQAFGRRRIVLGHEGDDGAEIAVGLRREDYRSTHARIFWRTCSALKVGSVTRERSPASMAASCSGLSSGMSRVVS
jgi:hypothetical protein